MTDKKGKPPRGPRDGGGARRGRDRSEASRDGKPPHRKEWRAKDSGGSRDGAPKRTGASAAGGAGERPRFKKPRELGEERAEKRSARSPREGFVSAGHRRDRNASAPQGVERPQRRAERDGETRGRAFAGKGERATRGSGERPTFRKPRAQEDERAARGQEREKRAGAGEGYRRDRFASASSGERPTRREELPRAAPRDGFERKREFAARSSDERPSFRKPRPQGEERGAEGRARPPREGGEGAAPRRDRFASAPRSDERPPRRKEWQDEPRGSGAARPRKASERGPRRYDAPARESAFEGERIAKAMARAGACSRRDAEQWIAEGRVSVNGRRLSSPAFNVKEGDSIEVDGKPLAERERTRLFLFHKPPGLVTSARDPEGRKTVFEHIKERSPDLPRLMSVGRLDINTQGLLLLSNDGGLARALELPATGWKRRYRVRAHGEVTQAALDELVKGVEIDGVAYAPIEAKIDRQQATNVWISMTLVEGKNREVKRVLGHLGLDVTRLIRVSFGPFQLGELDEGAIEEVRLKVLREQLGKAIADFAGVDFASPLREPTPAKLEEARAAAASRPRKHVSVLRREREARETDEPRTRIERATTADRKGRAVAVERVVAKGDKPDPSSRNARRFAAERREAQTDARDRTKASTKPKPRAPRKPR